MVERTLSMADGGPDDLPRTLRREREAREREAREREGQAPAFAPVPSYDPGPAQHAMPDHLTGTTVSRFDVPFLHLVAFFLKAVLAAIPAIILLGVLLWVMGDLLMRFFPDLVKMQILIRFPH